MGDLGVVGDDSTAFYYVELAIKPGVVPKSAIQTSDWDPAEGAVSQWVFSKSGCYKPNKAVL